MAEEKTTSPDATHSHSHAEEGTNPGNVDTQMDWNRRKTQKKKKKKNSESLHARPQGKFEQEQAMLAGITKRSAQWRQHRYLGSLRANV